VAAPLDLPQRDDGGAAASLRGWGTHRQYRHFLSGRRFTRNGRLPARLRLCPSSAGGGAALALGTEHGSRHRITGFRFFKGTNLASRRSQSSAVALLGERPARSPVFYSGAASTQARLEAAPAAAGHQPPETQPAAAALTRHRDALREDAYRAGMAPRVTPPRDRG
jgi:hypothetical protein